jgi:alkyl hydroperoxide reductase subunit AhpF
MALLSEEDRQTVRTHLTEIKRPVKLLFFTQTIGGPETGVIARQILDEVRGLSEQITVEEINFILEKEKAATYRVDKIPAIAVVKPSRDDSSQRDEDTRIRFYGVPAGYEFMSLIEAITLAGGEDSGLSPESKRLIAQVTSPIDLQVFVTPT